MAVETERERARLQKAESEVFAYYGVGARSEPLVLDALSLTTRVVRCGQGPATVLLHGTNLTSTVWAPLLPHLPGRTLYLVDLPGCGLADPFDDDGVDYPAHQTAFVGAVLDALGLDRAPLVGASLGGWFALRFAIEHPDRVTSLALVSAPALALPGARLPLMMALLGHPRLGRLFDALAPAPSARTTRRMLRTIGGRSSVRGVPDAMFEALGAAMALSRRNSLSAAPRMIRWRAARPDVAIREDELASCPVPALLVWGDEDKVQSCRAGIRAAHLLPDGRIEVLPGGHGIWFDEPARCGATLVEFLDSDHEAAW